MSENTTLDQVLHSAAHLQELVPTAVLVGGAASAYHAGHRVSFDHDHVLTDLAQRYAEVLDAVEASDGWVTSVRASSPPLTLLGSLDGIEAGLRQLRRTRPVEVEQVDLDTGEQLRVPTLPEMLRIKSYLVVQRNQVRDYLDTVALADRLGPEASVGTLIAIDDFYADRSNGDDSVLTALLQRLSEPAPRDTRVIGELSSYKQLHERWQDWDAVVSAAQRLADGIVRRAGGRTLSRLAFRNVDADPVDPVATWPYEGLVTAIERGTVGDWVRITAAIDEDPWGPLAQELTEYLGYARPYGVAPLLDRAIARARSRAERLERQQVADQVAEAIAATGLSMSEVARRLGTSRSRLSTYRSGRVMPSAAMLVRLHGLVARLTHPTGERPDPDAGAAPGQPG